MDTQDRLYEEIWKEDTVVEKDLQTLYRQVLNRDQVDLNKEDYVKWRQNSKGEIRSALENELSVQDA